MAIQSYNMALRSYNLAFDKTYDCSSWVFWYWKGHVVPNYIIRRFRHIKWHFGHTTLYLVNDKTNVHRYSYMLKGSITHWYITWHFVILYGILIIQLSIWYLVWQLYIAIYIYIYILIFIKAMWHLAILKVTFVNLYETLAIQLCIWHLLWQLYIDI